MSSESLGQAVANNTNWINSVISNSKLSSQLAELASIDSLDQKIVVQEGVLDAKYANAKTIRGYKGNWEADTNNPVLSNGSGVVGDIYKVSIGGNINIGSGSIDYVAGDLVYLSEDNWIKISPNQISDITGLQLALDSLADGLIPQGTWNALTNDPDIDGGIAETGYFWIVSIAGTTDIGGITDWEINDWAVKTATGWAKIDNTDKVLSVAGRTGVIVLSITDITGLTAALANCVKLTGNQSIAGEKTFTEVVTMTDRLDLSDSLQNSFIGEDTGVNNTTGDENIGLGYNSLFSNTTGGHNTAIGKYSLYSNISGSYNIAIGQQALYSSTTGSNNIGIGFLSLYTNSSGFANIGLGERSLEKNTTGSANMGIGQQALWNNTTGGSNTALGLSSLIANTTGNSNTAFGAQSLVSNTTGSDNVAMGSYSGKWIADGSTPNATSENSIFIGKNTKANANSETNQIVIGGDAIGNGSNTVTLGNDSIVKTILKGSVGIGTDSPDTVLNLEGFKNTSIITLGSTNNDGGWSVGDKIGAIDFYSYDGSGAGAGLKGSISYENEQGNTAEYLSLVFRTAGTSTGTNNTERMRIDSDGNTAFSGSISTTGTISGVLANGVTATTQTAGDNSTKVATTAYANAAASAIPIGDYLPLSAGSGFPLTGALTGTSATFTDDVTIDNSSPELYLTPDATKYSWMIAAQENVDQHFEITPSTAVGGTTFSTPALKISGVNSNATFAGNVEVRSGNKLILQRPNNGVATEISTDTTGAMILNSINLEGFDFQNGGVNALSINGAGKVGIGTDNPSANLEIESASNPEISIASTGGATSNYLNFKATSHTQPIQNQIKTVDNNDFTADLAFSFKETGTSGVLTERMRIEAGGNVGIGTDSPDKQLEILYPSYIDKDTVEGLLRLTGQSNTENAGDVPSAGVGIEFYNKWAGGDPFSIGRISARASQSYDGGLQFDVSQNTGAGQTNFITAMTILDTGNVGIGTTSPGRKLMVVGGDVYVTTKSDTVGTGSFGGNSFEIRNGDTSEDLNFDVYNRTAGMWYTPLIIKNTGNVGIGTVSPDANLEIDGGNVSTLRISGDGSNSSENKYAAIEFFNKDVSGAGSNIASSITVLSSSSTGAGGQLLFSTQSGSGSEGSQAVERMRINAQGVVSISNGTPTFVLQNSDNSLIANQIIGDINFSQSDPSGNGVGVVSKIRSINSSSFQGEAGLAFHTGTPTTLTERMRITSGGTVQVGATAGYTTINQGAFFTKGGGDMYTANLLAGASVTPMFKLQRNDVEKYNIGLDGNDSLAFINASGDAKVSITSGGNVLIGVPSILDATSRAYGNAFSGSSAYANWTSWGSGAHSHAVFRNATNIVGTITTNASATAYNTSSDYRLKEDLKDFAGLDMVSKIPVYDYKWKSSKDRSYGVMAHELQEVLPNSVTGEKDAEEMQGVDYSKIVPLLIKSIQELKAEIDILKAK